MIFRVDGTDLRENLDPVYQDIEGKVLHPPPPAVFPFHRVREWFLRS